MSKGAMVQYVSFSDAVRLHESEWPALAQGNGAVLPVDITSLMEALIAERREWRESNGVYSVGVMLAHGNVIAELEKIVDFEPDVAEDDYDG